MFLAAFVFLVIVVLLMIKPLTSALITAAFLAYIFHPIYEWLRKRINKESLSAFLVIILIILIFILPLILAFNALTKEIFSGYLIVKQKVATIELGGFNFLSDQPQLKDFFTNTFSKVTANIVDYTSTFVFKLSNRLIDFFIVFFVTYYLLKDGKNVLLKIKKALPIKKSYQEEVFKKFNNTIYGVIYGNIIIALIQGTLATLGFYLFGVSSPILWGLLTAVLALIPFLGAFVVWLSISLFYFINGLADANSAMIGNGILLFFYGMFIISGIDNVLKPKIISGKAKIHPVLVLIGVIGGIKFFGFIGVVAGPVLLALLMAFIDIYIRAKKQN